jgi:fatty acid desaturase
MPTAASAEGDHRAALAAIGQERLAVLAEPSDLPGLIRLASHLGLLLLTGTAVLLAEGSWRLPLQAVHGVILVFLFTALHECIHRTAFRTVWINDAVAAFAGFTYFQPATGFRYFHFAHHRYTQDPQRDPELALAKPRTRAEYFWLLTGWHFWIGQARLLITNAIGHSLPGYIPPRAHGKVIREARIHLALYTAILLASTATGSTLALTLWLVPAILGQPAMRAYLLAEHTGCPLVPDMLANSRTTFAHRATRWLAWEMPWHTAHHAAPTIPFHRLAELTGEIEHALKSTARGYLDAQAQILRAIDADR